MLYEVITQTLEAEKEKVAIASVIRAINMSFESYNHKGKPTDKAKKVLRLAIAFTLDENPIAPQGKKNIYVRFTNPENHILLNSEENTFSYEGEQIAYSAVREINYEGLAVDGIVYYENTGEPLISGTYKVDIFCDGHTIGTKSLVITSYSIHYTKLYEPLRVSGAPSRWVMSNTEESLPPSDGGNSYNFV